MTVITSVRSCWGSLGLRCVACRLFEASGSVPTGFWEECSTPGMYELDPMRADRAQCVHR